MTDPGDDGNDQEQNEYDNTLHVDCSVDSSPWSDDGKRSLVPPKLLAGCEIAKETLSSSETDSNEFDAAITRLLRTRRKEGASYTHIRHIRQANTWDCGTLYNYFHQC